MGMTIDEIIDCFIRLKDTIEEGENVDPATCEIYPVTVAFGKEDCIEVKEVVDGAISTMRKYQKIEDIYYHQSGQALENSLKAVIEDGKIN